MSPRYPFLGIDVNSSMFDAFGRQRVSGTGQRLDVEFIYDKQPDFFDEITNNGTVTHNTNSRDLTLSLDDAVDGSYATMRSHPAPYTPGNSQLIDITGVLNLANLPSAEAEVFLRSSISGSVTEEIVPEAQWSALKGSIDWADSQIFSMDFQSLKVGTIRYGLVYNGAFVQVAEIRNDNERDSGYWQMPSLQAYWRIYNDATYTYMETGYGDEANAIGFRVKVAASASATLKAICCTVKSEGGLDLADLPGIARCTDNHITPVTVSTTLVPVLSIRVRDTFNSLPNLGIIIPQFFDFQTTEAVKLVAVQNGTLTDPDWNNVDADASCVEFDVAATGISNGETVLSGYKYAVSTGPQSGRVTANQNSVLGKTVLWDRQSSVTGILSICAIRTGSSDASVLSSMQWKEIR